MNSMDKKELRAMMAQQKHTTAPSARLDLSGPVLRRLAVHPRFTAARTVLLYHSLPDEVDTSDFVRYWSLRKNILLPSVKGKDIELHRYAPGDGLESGMLPSTLPSFQAWLSTRKATAWDAEPDSTTACWHGCANILYI